MRLHRPLHGPARPREALSQELRERADPTRIQKGEPHHVLLHEVSPLSSPSLIQIAGRSDMRAKPKRLLTPQFLYEPIEL